MNKAILFDRDGVINKERGEYTYQKDDFIINEGVYNFIKTAIEKGYLIIIISNQGGVAKGIYSKSTIEELHNYMKFKMKEHNIIINDIYYCPHHNNFGKCLCRKPNSLLVEKVLAKYKIDASKSFLIGDKQRDIDAADKSGVKGVLIKSNENLISYKHILK